MNKKEIKKAEKLLEPYVSNTDTAICNDGQCITAYWTNGGQQVFYGLEAIIESVCI